jgi:ABC-type bacteriocin/lantibiotic exporter with double-glycine peptidase domain
LHGSSLPAPKGAIEFKSVNFRYSPEGQDVLKDIALSVKPGEVIGIVGPSGSGKSTLTKLVQRFYIPNNGQVFIDGQDNSRATKRRRSSITEISFHGINTSRKSEKCYP